MENKRKGILFFYGLPAYGHTLSNLYLTGRLAGAGFRVVYYSAEPFREAIEENGCEYRAYPMDWEALDLTDGERVPKLYRLILEYTWKMLPKLLAQAEKEKPKAVIFDSLALWGRAVGQLCSLPSFSYYSIAAIDWTWGFPWVQGSGITAADTDGSHIRSVCKEKQFPYAQMAGRQDGFQINRNEKENACRFPFSPWGKGLGAYAPGFSAGFLRYAGEIPQALGYAKRLKEKYGLESLGLLPVLMNRGDYNLCGYSRLFQPGGRGFGREYIFAGPLSVHRKISEYKGISCLDTVSSIPLIYISLGTVFNQNEEFLQMVIDQLGTLPLNLSADGLEDRKETCPGRRGRERFRRKSFRVILVWNGDKTGVFPENFTVRPFVNQNEVLKHASLFITAGGVNSLHEALYFGVPCLMCPQQGEQRLNAQRFERLGFGRILRDPKRLQQEALECMELKKQWNEKRRKQMTAVPMGKVLELFEACGPKENGMGQNAAKDRKQQPQN